MNFYKNMSNNYIKLAQTYSKAGFSVIPVSVTKIPTIREWREYQNRPMTSDECEKYFDNAHGIALIGGVNGVIMFDHDLKNDITGDYYKRLVSRMPKKLMDKFYIQTTQNKGVHWMATTDAREGNLKLASRFATSEEKHKIYIESFENPKTRDKALKIASNFTTLVLSETRFVGGYCLIAPTPGYTKVSGKIGFITSDEYEEVKQIIRSMDEGLKVLKEDSSYKSFIKDEWKINPFEDANERMDIVQLLEMNGWNRVGGSYRNSIRFKRPGNSSTSSAILDTGTNLFSVFTTSTDLDVKAYNAVGLYTHFECDGDSGLCYKKLVTQGFGVKN